MRREMAISNNDFDLWELLDFYSEIEKPTWDESFLHEEEFHPKDTEVFLFLQNEKPSFKPHRNPLKENLKDIKAEYLQDLKGNFLLYPGHIHLLYGKPGTYKSWVALSLIGKYEVRYWDFENFGPILATRMRLMGVKAEDAGVFAYPETRTQIFELVEEYVITKPDILVVDGMSGISRTMGLNTDANDQVEKLFNDVFMPLKRAGICVLILDHLPKDSPVDDFPIGAQAKKSQSDVAILMKTRRDSDLVDVLVSKDRNFDLFSRCESGTTPRLYGWLIKPSAENNFKAVIEPDLIALINGQEIDSFDSALYEEVWHFVQESPGTSGTRIEENVSGKNSRIRTAVQWLTSNGFLEQSKKGNGTHYRTEKVLKDAIEWRSRGDYFPLI
jgi:hypothetical protein